MLLSAEQQSTMRPAACSSASREWIFSSHLGELSE